MWRVWNQEAITISGLKHPARRTRQGPATGSIFQRPGRYHIQPVPQAQKFIGIEVTDSSALLSWIIQDSATSFKVDVKSGSQTTYYSNTINTPDTFYLALGLEPMGNYKFRVVATCTDGSTSGSSDWSNFRTLGLRDTTVVDSTGSTDTTRVVDSLTVQSSPLTSQVVNKPTKSQRGNDNRKTMRQRPFIFHFIPILPISS